MDDRVTPADSGETTADDKEAPMDEREWARSRQALAEGFEECRDIIGALGDETRQQSPALLEAENAACAWARSRRARTSPAPPCRTT